MADAWLGGQRPDHLDTPRSKRPPRAYDRSLALLVEKADIPRLTSHGLRHTAATHMVNNAKDIGELRAIADILGHSPEMLLTVDAHALPQSRWAIVDRLTQEPS